MAIRCVCAFLVVTMLPLCTAHPAIRNQVEKETFLCENCGDNCNMCKFGVSFSPMCEVWQCRKGPGEICGGRDDKYGECGDGLSCHCNKCVGCSTDSLDCYVNSCLPHKEIQLSHLKHFNDFIFGK